MCRAPPVGRVGRRLLSDLEGRLRADVAARVGPTEASLREPIDVLPGESPGDEPVRSWAFRRHGAWH